MKIHEIEWQIEQQYSMMRSFPSQTPSLDQMYEGQNRRLAIEIQIESTKLLADQRIKLETMDLALGSMSGYLERHRMDLQQREKIEDERFQKNMRLSKIAAWSGVISAALAALSVVIQIAAR